MAAASPASLGHPAGGPCQTKWQSSMGVSLPPQFPPQPTPAASIQQPTDSKDHDHCLTIVSRYAGYFDVATEHEVPRWVGWTGIDGFTSWLRLLLIGFEYHQTNVKYLEKIANVIVMQ